MYYLQSRYYNPEWGRFINADAIAGSVGELLGHNIFAYCKNNVVNKFDPAGFRALSIDSGLDSGNSTVFSPVDSAKKGTISGSIDKVGEVIGGAVIKEKKVWQDMGTWGLGKYGSNLSKGAKFGKKVLGIGGTIGFTLRDVKDSLAKGEYFGAGIDILSGAAGFGAGLLIGIGAGALITVSTPAILVGGIGVGAFALSVGAGIIIDKYATYIKDVHYRRRVE